MNQVPADSSTPIQSLKLTELSKRVGISYQKLSHVDVAMTSAGFEHDPDGYHRTYCKNSNLFNIAAV